MKYASAGPGIENRCTPRKASLYRLWTQKAAANGLLLLLLLLLAVSEQIMLNYMAHYLLVRISRPLERLRFFRFIFAVRCNWHPCSQRPQFTRCSLNRQLSSAPTE